MEVTRGLPSWRRYALIFLYYSLPFLLFSSGLAKYPNPPRSPTDKGHFGVLFLKCCEVTSCVSYVNFTLFSPIFLISLRTRKVFETSLLAHKQGSLRPVILEVLRGYKSKLRSFTLTFPPYFLSDSAIHKQELSWPVILNRFQVRVYLPFFFIIPTRKTTGSNALLFSSRFLFFPTSRTP